MHDIIYCFLIFYIILNANIYEMCVTWMIQVLMFMTRAQVVSSSIYNCLLFLLNSLTISSKNAFVSYIK
jgi:hypothetical protein